MYKKFEGLGGLLSADQITITGHEEMPPFHEMLAASISDLDVSGVYLMIGVAPPEARPLHLKDVQAFAETSGIPVDGRATVMLYIDRHLKFPHTHRMLLKDESTANDVTFSSMDEWVLFLLAHECRHVHQHNAVPLTEEERARHVEYQQSPQEGYDKTDKRTVREEDDANLYAMAVLEYYRQKDSS